MASKKNSLNIADEMPANYCTVAEYAVKLKTDKQNINYRIRQGHLRVYPVANSWVIDLDHPDTTNAWKKKRKKGKKRRKAARAK